MFLHVTNSLPGNFSFDERLFVASNDLENTKKMVGGKIFF
jgi:hypothetical protein